MKKRATNMIDIKVVTWEKQSQGLFDYENKSLKQKHYQIENSCILLQNQRDSEVIIASDTSFKNLAEKHGYAILGAMDLNNAQDHFAFRSIKKTSIESKQQFDPFLVVRSLKNHEGQQKGYQLKLGDIIKFGRLQYLVLQYADEKNVFSQKDINIKFESHFASQNKLEGTCKICLSEEQDQDNFLISPCDCKGSCELVHLLCLKQWIQSKICKETHGIVESYNFNKYECEICKVQFPQKVVKGGKQYQMLLINKPKQPYIILQSISDKKDQKNLHLVTSKKSQNIKIGRGHECDIRLNDISVSRVHAQICFKNNRFSIFDNSSKFGTLIKLRNNLAITHEKCAVQVGRTVLVCTQKINSKHSNKENRREVVQHGYKAIVR